MTGQPAPALRVLINQSEIADLFADGARSNVKNWIERSNGTFPSEIDRHGRSPLFDAEEVFDWLVKSEQSPVRIFSRKRLPRPRWWWRKTAEQLQATRVAEVRAGLTAIVLLRSAALGEVGTAAHPDRWQQLREHFDLDELCELASDIESADASLDGLLGQPLREFTLTADEWRILLDRLEQARREASSSQLLSDALWGHATSWAESMSMSATTRPLAEVIADVGSPSAGDTILDPACGEGGLLAQCVRVARADSGQEPPKIYGQEYDVVAWKIARSVLLLEGVSAELGEPGRDSIDQSCWGDLRADLVVVDTPVVSADTGTSSGYRQGDAFGHAPVAWLHRAVKHLADDGRLVIVLPGFSIARVSTARRQPSGRLQRELQALAQAGRIESVIMLPSRTRPDIPGPITIWVISGSGVSHAESLLLDTLDAKLSKTQTVVGWPAELARLGEVVADWRSKRTIPPSDESLITHAVSPSRIVKAAIAALVAGGTNRIEQISGWFDLIDDVAMPLQRVADVPPGLDVDFAAERAEMLVHVDAIIDELEDHIESLAVDDPERYQRLRGRVKALQARPRP